MTRKKYAFVFNLITVLGELTAYAELRAARKRSNQPKLPLFFFYTQLSNIVTLISAFMFLMANRKSPKEWVRWLRYLSCCMLSMTFTVVMLVLIPMGDDPKKLLWNYHSFIHHVAAPIVTVASYFLCEEGPEKRSAFWLPIVVTEVYGSIMIALNALGKVNGPYPFFKVKEQGVPKTIFWMIILTIVIGLDAKIMQKIKSNQKEKNFDY